ncbi:MAG: uncharacterized protein JWP03_3861 [Phycisphaerales bacterium]|jgi:glycosyltransferase involved in cell wall biosynthesis|nr:uncharacterized protein [Phycisphaerales bacterium]
MRSVLFIGTGVPWAGGAGYLVRQNMFLRALSEIALLEIALFDFPDRERVARPAFARQVTPLPPPGRRSVSTLGAFISDFFTFRPRMVRGYQMAGPRGVVRRLQPERFDAVFCFRIDFAHFAGVLGERHLLLDVDDPEHTRWRRQLQATLGTRGDFRTRYDLRKLARFEKAAVRRAKAAFVCQSLDRETFSQTPLVVPNCVQVPPTCPPRRASRPRIVFIGDFSVRRSPNVDALEWFVGQIWPAISQAVPECELHVIGRIGESAARQIAAAPKALAVGYVEDLGAALCAASLSVAPIRFGTGTRIKILDSFAHGCPVVSTPIGCEGIPVTDGKDILLARTPAEFVEACVALLRDEGLGERLGTAGYELVSARFDEAKQRRRLTETLAGLLGAARAQVPAADVSLTSNALREEG